MCLIILQVFIKDYKLIKVPSAINKINYVFLCYSFRVFQKSYTNIYNKIIYARKLPIVAFFGLRRCQ